jgi:hypothetical protein
MPRLLVFLTMIMTSYCVHSQWYETEGQAYINNGDNKAARAKAIENALKKTLLVAGASVSSVQQVVNGLLTKDELNIRATGIINSFELVSENYTNDTASVTIRADIFPQQKKCFSADYRKSLLITRSNLLNREQANVGEIYQLNQAVMNRLAKQINQEGRYLSSKLNLKNKTNFSKLNNSLQVENIKRLTLTLASHYDVQFVMYSEIVDLSFNQQIKNAWKFWQDDIKDRQFKVNIYIYDGISGESIFEKPYQMQAPWTHPYRKNVDVHSSDFWQSPYGMSINRILDDIALDVDENLMCHPTHGSIVNIEGAELIINLGKRHGVNIGDEFSLLHSANIISQQGKSYAGYNVSPYKVKVIQTTMDSAKVVAINGEPLGNIQLQDMVVRH